MKLSEQNTRGGGNLFPKVFFAISFLDNIAFVLLWKNSIRMLQTSTLSLNHRVILEDSKIG